MVGAFSRRTCKVCGFDAFAKGILRGCKEIQGNVKR